MLDEIKTLVTLGKTRKHVTIGGFVFNLHCRFTALYLVIGMFIATSNQLFGERIYCDHADGDLKIDVKMLNSYCMALSTHTAFSNQNSSKLHSVYSMKLPLNSSKEKVFISYYQWFLFIYFIEALFFYFPYYMWKNWEANRIKCLVDRADAINQMYYESASQVENTSLARIACHVVSSFGNNKRYMLTYYLCETIAFLNLLFQLIVLNRIFNNRYLTYGFDVWRHWHEGASLGPDPMDTVFPKMTRCTYFRYGPSGYVDNLEALCVLTLNIFNDKCMLILWVWIYLLLAMFALLFIYRIIQCLFPSIRIYFFSKLIYSDDENLKKNIPKFMLKLSLADWFFLNLAAQNIDRIFLYRLIGAIINCFHQREENRQIIRDCNRRQLRQESQEPMLWYSPSQNNIVVSPESEHNSDKSKNTNNHADICYESNNQQKNFNQAFLYGDNRKISETPFLQTSI